MTRVVLVGAGGLGAPIALTLAAAGVELVIYDPDTVDATNLHRQLAFSLDDVGRPKASLLAAAAARRGAVARAVQAPWTAECAEEVDVIVEGSDAPHTKFAVADWALARGLPYVIAGALGTAGNVFAGAPGAACYRCLFEQPPDEAPTCAQAGVLGPIVGQLAALACHAALALASGARDLAGTIWVLDGLSRPARHLRLTPRAGCASCG